MSEPRKHVNVRWDDETLSWICCNRDIIRWAAGKIGVSAGAIAGQMAKDNHYAGNEPFKTVAADAGVVAAYLSGSDTLISIAAGKSFGLAKIHVRTAVGLMNAYLNGPNPDKGVKDYLEPYYAKENRLKLVETLIGADGDLCGESGKLIALLYALYVKEGMDFIAKNVDSSDWNELSQVEKDGILVTYCSMGQGTFRESYPVDANGKLLVYPWDFDPSQDNDFDIRPNDAGGRNHIYNSRLIAQMMGVSVNYDSHVQKAYGEACPTLGEGDFEYVRNLFKPLVQKRDRTDPLALDLDGDGLVETTSVESGAHFDY